MSKALTVILKSMSENKYWKDEDIQVYFESIIELIQYGIINKNDKIKDKLIMQNMDGWKTIKTNIQSIEELLIYIQKQSLNIDSNNITFNNKINDTLKDFYNFTDYNSLFKLKLDNIKFYEGSSSKKLLKVLSDFPSGELNKILEESDINLKENDHIADFILYVLTNSSVQKNIFNYIDKEIFLNGLFKMKNINMPYIFSELNCDDEKKSFNNLLNIMDNLPEINNKTIFNGKCFFESLLDSDRDVMPFIIKNYSNLPEEQKKLTKEHIFNKFFDESLKDYQKPSVMYLYNIDNKFYELPEFNEDIIISFFKREHSEMFYLLKNDKSFRKYIEQMDFNPLSLLIHSDYIPKEKIDNYIKDFPDLLTLNKNKSNNLTDFLCNEKEMANWYQNAFYVFKALNLEAFAKKGEDVYLNLFNQDFYFTLLTSQNYPRNKTLIKKTIDLFEKKLVKYEHEHNIKEPLSGEYFELMKISLDYMNDKTTKNAQNILDKLNKTNDDLTINILSSPLYIETLCSKNNDNKAFRIKLEKILFEKAMPVNSVEIKNNKRL